MHLKNLSLFGVVLAVFSGQQLNRLATSIATSPAKLEVVAS